jgi:invasion protein IalB
MFCNYIGLMMIKLSLGKLCKFTLIHFFVLCVEFYPATAQNITTPAIDVSMFREGEVQRVNATFGAWSTVCDEIKRLNQRFCSLKAVMRDMNGQNIAHVTVSTSDNGKPAAIVRVGAGTHIGTGAHIRIEPVSMKGAKKSTSIDHPISFVTCDKAGCNAIWSLTHAEISALNKGAKIYIRIAQVRPFGPLVPVMSSPERLTMLEASVEGNGFAQAVNSTLK